MLGCSGSRPARASLKKEMEWHPGDRQRSFPDRAAFLVVAEVVPLGGPRVRRTSRPIGPTIVRGELGDLEADRLQCLDFLKRYEAWGRFGLSAFEFIGPSDLDRIAARQLERFPALSLFEVATLVHAGFEVVPTFRTPHVTVAFVGDVRHRLEVLTSMRVEIRANAYHRHR